MSSPIENRSQQSARAANRANGWASTSRIIGLLAAVAGIALLGVFVIQAGILAPRAPQDVAPDVAIANPEQITGENSRITGLDKNKRPFEIRAKTGQQDKTVETLVHLQTVTGAFERPSGSKLDVTAAAARYDTKSKDLALDGNVVFSEGERFKALMDKAKVNMDDQSLQSLSPVTVDMQGAHILADSLSVTDQGNRILFKGGVKARFVTKPQATGDGG